MEEILKQILAANEKQIEILSRIAKSLDGNKVAVSGKQPEGYPVTFVPETQPDGTKKLKETKPAKEEKAKPAEDKKPEITIEQLREAATKFSAAFSMDALLDLNEKFGGAKKLSKVAPENYAALYAEIERQLAANNGAKATEYKAPRPCSGCGVNLDEPNPVHSKACEIAHPKSNGALTLDQVKAAGKSFMDKNGQGALVAILKIMGAERLSALDPAKYAAFVEAVSNA